MLPRPRLGRHPDQGRRPDHPPDPGVAPVLRRGGRRRHVLDRRHAGGLRVVPERPVLSAAGLHLRELQLRGRAGDRGLDHPPGQRRGGRPGAAGVDPGSAGRPENRSILTTMPSATSTSSGCGCGTGFGTSGGRSFSRKGRPDTRCNPSTRGLTVTGPAGKLRGHYDHFTDPTLDAWLAKLNYYTDRDTERMEPPVPLRSAPASVHDPTVLSAAVHLPERVIQGRVSRVCGRLPLCFRSVSPILQGVGADPSGGGRGTGHHTNGAGDRSRKEPESCYP